MIFVSNLDFGDMPQQQNRIRTDNAWVGYRFSMQGLTPMTAEEYAGIPREIAKTGSQTQMGTDEGHKKVTSKI